ncbi:MAG TPA: hypothetical protein VHO67_07790 [Polyangia bacterium]|nr:hypothetical protein [Polyangia bacterium]
MSRRGGARLAAASGVLLFSMLLAWRAGAHEVNLARLDEGPANRVYVRTGAEWAFVAGVGYARTVSVGQRRLVLLGELTAPWAAPDASDYQVRAGALVPVAGWRRWQLAGSLEPTVRGTNNDLGRMTSLGAYAGVVGGYYTQRWFAAGELGFDYAVTTHITQSQLYRDTVYEGARDGWYVNPGGNYRLGGQAGASFGRYELAARGGVLRDMLGHQPMFPYYATLAFSTSW